MYQIDDKAYNKAEFCQLFLDNMKLKTSNDELSAISSILELFNDVSMAYNDTPKITIKQMTDYFIENVMNVGDKFKFVVNKYNRYPYPLTL